MWSHLADENLVFTHGMGDEHLHQGAYPAHISGVGNRPAMSLAHRRIVVMARPDRGRALLVTGNVPKVLLGQLMHAIHLSRVSHRFSRSVARRRASGDNSGLFQRYQVTVQTRPRDACGFRKFPRCTRAHPRQVPEQGSLSAAADHTHCNLNFRREVGIDEDRHVTILPDAGIPLRVIVLPYC